MSVKCPSFTRSAALIFPFNKCDFFLFSSFIWCLICMSPFSIYVYLCLSFDESALEFGPWCCWKVLIVAMTRLHV